jgi:predicted enzyme related to lactoylglutathione lyase
MFGISGSVKMSVTIEQKSYEMPPSDGFTITLFITVADIDRSADFYEKVFGGRVLSRGDSKGASGHIQIANTWLIVNVGGGPTPDKPTVTLSVLAAPDTVSSFMNIRVADIQACYALWKSRGAEFITEPIPKYGSVTLTGKVSHRSAERIFKPVLGLHLAEIR